MARDALLRARAPRRWQQHASPMLLRAALVCAVAVVSASVSLPTSAQADTHAPRTPHDASVDAGTPGRGPVTIASFKALYDTGPEIVGTGSVGVFDGDPLTVPEFRHVPMAMSYTSTARVVQLSADGTEIGARSEVTVRPTTAFLSWCGDDTNPQLTDPDTVSLALRGNAGLGADDSTASPLPCAWTAEAHAAGDTTWEQAFQAREFAPNVTGVHTRYVFPLLRDDLSVYRHPLAGDSMANGLPELGGAALTFGSNALDAYSPRTHLNKLTADTLTAQLSEPPTSHQRALIAGLRRETRAAQWPTTLSRFDIEQGLVDVDVRTAGAGGGERRQGQPTGEGEVGEVGEASLGSESTGRDYRPSNFWSASTEALRAQILHPASDPRHFALWPIVRHVYYSVWDASVTDAHALLTMEHDLWARRYARIAVDPQLVDGPESLDAAAEFNAGSGLAAEGTTGEEQLARGRTAQTGRGRGAALPFAQWRYSTMSSMQKAALIAQYESATSERVDGLGLVVDFGAGFGAIAGLVLHNTGFTGGYVLVDMPVQRALHRFYLRLIGVNVVDTIDEFVAAMRANAEATDVSQRRGVALSASVDDMPRVIEAASPWVSGPRLFAATWSLSEIEDLDLRDAVVSSVLGFEAFLVTYQVEFFDVDNAAWFGAWTTRVEEAGHDAGSGSMMWWRSEYLFNSNDDRILVGRRDHKHARGMLSRAAAALAGDTMS